MLAVMPFNAAAQDASSPPPQLGTSMTVSGMVSAQPAGSPDYYASAEGLGGVAPGIAFAVGAPRRRGVTVDLEVSTNWPISKELRSGSSGYRYSNSDTLATILVGQHKKLRVAWIEYKAGGSLVFGRSFDEGSSNRLATESNTAAGRWALTAGVDWTYQPDARRPVVIGVKYSYAFRKDTPIQLLGPHILRINVGIRWHAK